MAGEAAGGLLTGIVVFPVALLGTTGMLDVEAGLGLLAGGLVAGATVGVIYGWAGN